MTTDDHLIEEPETGLDSKPRWHPNRIAVYLTSLAGIAGAVAIPLGDMDTTSTAGVIAGVGAIVAAVVTWLRGWQKHEERMEQPPS